MPILRISLSALLVVALSSIPSLQAQQNLQQPQREIGDRPDGTPSDQTERYETRRIAIDSSAQQPLSITTALLMKLHKSSEAEIELAQLAAKRTDNDQVRELAQQFIEDHQKLNQRIEQALGSKEQPAESASISAPLESPAQARQKDPRVATKSADAMQSVPPQLVQIGQQACENALAMTEEMLSNYEGQDFSMAFLGQQSVSFTMALAELKAIESVGPEELQPIAQTAITTVESHLQQAKQLAKKLEDDRRLQSARR